MRMTGGLGRPHATAPCVAPDADLRSAHPPAETAPDPDGKSPAAKGTGWKIASDVSASGRGERQQPGAVPDDVLIQRLRDGDVPAGEVLVKRHYEPLIRYLQRLAGMQVADELHQQTWLSVLD